MTTIRKGYVDCSEGQIHYREAGSLKIQQSVSSIRQLALALCLRKVLAILGADYHCYALDTPGFGQSFQPAAIPDLQYPARLLLEPLRRWVSRNFTSVVTTLGVVSR